MLLGGYCRAVPGAWSLVPSWLCMSADVLLERVGACLDPFASNLPSVATWLVRASLVGGVLFTALVKHTPPGVQCGYSWRLCTVPAWYSLLGCAQAGCVGGVVVLLALVVGAAC